MAIVLTPRPFSVIYRDRLGGNINSYTMFSLMGFEDSIQACKKKELTCQIQKSNQVNAHREICLQFSQHFQILNQILTFFKMSPRSKQVSNISKKILQSLIRTYIHAPKSQTKYQRRKYLYFLFSIRTLIQIIFYMKHAYDVNYLTKI